MASKGQSGMGQDQDDTIFVPYTTVMKKLRGITYIQQVTVSAASAGETTRVADSIATLLRTRHKIQPGEPDDFMVRTMEEMASVRKEATQTMTALLASIAGVSLLVGGIGIMNIMLVSVTERTREIGLRMAIGARGRDVLLQFLVEAVVLSLFGGGIGIALGFGLARGVTFWQGWPTAVSANAVARGVRVRGHDRRVLRLLSRRGKPPRSIPSTHCDSNDVHADCPRCSLRLALAASLAAAACSGSEARPVHAGRAGRGGAAERGGAGDHRASSREVDAARAQRHRHRRGRIRPSRCARRSPAS